MKEDIKNIKDTNSFAKLSDDEAWLVLFLLAYADAEKYWYEFKEEISHKHRFFPKSELLDMVKGMKEAATTVLNKGQIYYRARVNTSSFLEFEHNKKILNELRETIDESFPDLKDKSFEEVCYYFQNPIMQLDNKVSEKLDSLLSVRKEFWGYEIADIDSPPSVKATAGRANPAGISYLYVCDSRKTAIMEVRPMIGQEVSVATIELSDDIKLFDFCKNNGIYEKGGDAYIYYLISRAFSEPYTGNEKDYYPTQFLTEFIKEMGFEGIRFYSSYDSNSKNIVIFNTQSTDEKKYIIKSSEVHLVKGYNLDYMRIVPIDRTPKDNTRNM